MKVHYAVIRRNRFGGVTNGSLCGRLNSACRDGMNITDLPSLVTCGFCKRRMAAKH